MIYLGEKWSLLFSFSLPNLYWKIRLFLWQSCCAGKVELVELDLARVTFHAFLVDIVTKINNNRLLQHPPDALDEILMGWICRHIVVTILHGREFNDEPMRQAVLLAVSTLNEEQGRQRRNETKRACSPSGELSFPPFKDKM
jgi:hypothetical protein